MKKLSFYKIIPIILFLIIFHPFGVEGQSEFYKEFSFTKKDSLRGDLRPERTCFDIQHYYLDIEIDPATKSLGGSNTITYSNICENQNVIQIDLFENMSINTISCNDTTTTYERVENAIFIDLINQKKGQNKLKISYEGIPTEALNAPWDGGFTWAKDETGSEWVSVSCQGVGASLWWPCIDHQSIESDSTTLRITGPDSLDIVANGTEISQETINGKRVAVWKVHDPINTYNVHVSLGKYSRFDDTYINTYGDSLSLEYYVMKKNVDKAKVHFKDVPKTLEAFEHYFGLYPYYKDGYALIETPFLGMEHQSGIAYGNKYMYGYLGRKALNNMNWDYIIVHETGHEWFGNYLTAGDISDIWLHESFTTYSEALFVEYWYGYNTSIAYLSTQRKHFNKYPLLGPTRVNFEGWSATDHYYKGTWILHTLRHVIDDDDLWFDIIKSFVEDNAHGTIKTQDFIDHVNKKTEEDYTYFFNQYLRYPTIPTFNYKIIEKENQTCMEFNWRSDIDTFNMPFEFNIGNQRIRLAPTVKDTKEICFDKNARIFPRNDLFLVNMNEIK